MDDNVFQKKEKEELLKQFLVFAVIFVFLMVVVSPSFKFTPPPPPIEEKEDYSKIINFLEDFDLNQFQSFSMTPIFDEEPGRSNPFLDDFQDETEIELVEDDREEFIEEETEETEETEEEL